jgi:hypothetical protein
MGVHCRGMYYSIGVDLTGVNLMGVYFTGVHLTGVYLIGVHFMGVHLTGVHLIGVYLTGVQLILWVCSSQGRNCLKAEVDCPWKLIVEVDCPETTRWTRSHINLYVATLFCSPCRL